MKTTRTCCAFLVVCFGLFSLLHPAFAHGPFHDSEPCLAASRLDSLWAGFRKDFPYHLQTLALSERQPDASRLLIISEPPPHADVARIRTMLAAFDPVLQIKKQRIGNDGWVKDLVLVLKNTQQEVALQETLQQVHEYLFLTSYKADYLYLEQPAPFADERNWNQEIQAREIRQWMEEEESFYPVQGGAAEPIKKILSANRYGVFYSLRPGLVAWILPANSDIGPYLKDARIFSIDADLILGAMAQGKAVAILGRERMNSLTTLPPLRLETISLLASAYKQELGQSFERKQFFAGRYDGRRDWAPIYLSDELKNTELGSLLNITDQLLKSWSCNGGVRYLNFQYPDPQTWCFGQSIATELGAGQLTFNWNTKGATYSIKDGATEYVALSRTGALPVSYIPNEDNPTAEQTKAVGPYEDLAYGCFANWQDPNLVRVVQYTALFQIFRQFQIGVDAKPAPRAGSGIMVEEVKTFIARLRALPRAEIEPLAIEETRSRLRFNGSFTERQKDSIILLKAQPRIAQLDADRLKVQAGFAGLERNFGAPGMDYLVRRLADERNAPKYARMSELIDAFNQFYNEFLHLQDKFEDKEAVKNRYAAAFMADTGVWIKSPALVVSWEEPEPKFDEQGRMQYFVGGHNLGMSFPVLEPDPDLPPGQVRIRQGMYRNIVRMNPADFARLSPRVIRIANKSVWGYEMDRLAQEVNEALADNSQLPLRKRTDVIPAFENLCERGYCTQARRLKLLDWLPTLGYSDIKDFRVKHGLPVTETADQAFFLQLEQEIHGLRSFFYSIGHEGENLTAEIKAYRALTETPPTGFDGLTPELRQQIERDRETLRQLADGPEKDSGVSIVEPEHPDGSRPRRYALIGTKDNAEVWEIDGRKILLRKKGRAGLKLLEDAANQNAALWSTGQVAFARLNSFDPNSPEILVNLNGQTLAIAKSEALAIIQGEPEALPPTIKSLYAFMAARVKDNPDAKIIFQVDPFLEAGGRPGDGGTADLIENIYPQTHFLDPHKFAAALAQYRSKAGEAGIARLQFGLCRSNLKLARQNAENIPPISNIREVALLFSADQNLAETQLDIVGIKNDFTKKKGSFFGFGKDELVFEGNNFILITGVKTEAFRQQVLNETAKGRFKGKCVILLSCFEGGEVAFNKLLLEQGDARAVWFLADRIELPPLRLVLHEFGNRLISGDQKAMDPYELFYQSVEAVLRKKSKDKEVRMALEKLLRGLFQFAFQTGPSGTEQQTG